MTILVIFVIKCYQKLLSPQTGFFRFCYFSPIFNLNPGIAAGCRQKPSCSEYCIQAVAQNGVVKGLALAAKRLSRCR